MNLSSTNFYLCALIFCFVLNVYVSVNARPTETDDNVNRHVPDDGDVMNRPTSEPEVFAVFDQTNSETGSHSEIRQRVDFNGELAEKAEESQTLFKPVRAGSRRQRPSGTAELRKLSPETEQIDTAAAGLDEEMVPSTRARIRSRRSAIGWIQAAVRLCDTGRSNDRRCRRIDVNDGRVHVTVRLSDN